MIKKSVLLLCVLHLPSKTRVMQSRSSSIYTIACSCLRYKEISKESFDKDMSKICRRKPDFCRKLSIKYPSSPVITRFDGFVILSDFHSVFSKIKAFKKFFWLLLFPMYRCHFFLESAITCFISPRVLILLLKSIFVTFPISLRTSS